MSRAIKHVLLLFALVACVSSCSRCDDDDAIVPEGVLASFADSGTPAAADSVRLAGSASSDVVTVDVRIGGPTTSTDLHSFAFDLVLGDTAVAEYVAGSATLGGALTAGGGATPQVFAVQQGDRVAVGVAKLGGPGNGVTEPGETIVVRLRFRVPLAGTCTLSFDGPPGGDPAALDSAGATIGSITFDTAPARLLGI